MKVLLVYLDPLDNEPMGLLCIGTALSHAGHEVKLAGTPRAGRRAYLSGVMRKFSPDAVGITLTTPQTAVCAEITRYLKEEYPQVPVILGGPHPSILPEEALRDIPADVCVIGEGEVTVVELLPALKGEVPLDQVQGIAFRRDGNIVVTARRPFIEDLDQLPFADRELLPKEVIYGRAGYPLENPCMLIMTVRGCPFRCAFCQPGVDAIFGQKIRRRSADNTVEEIFQLHKKYGILGFWMQDDTFMYDREWTLRFCSLLKERGLRISWYANGRINAVTRELLTAMKDAGCEGVVLTPESGSERIRNEVLHKNLTEAQIEEAYRLCHEIGLPAQANIMLASPSETEQDLARSFALISRIQPHFMNYSYTTMLPGTYLYQSYSGEPDFKEYYPDCACYSIGTFKKYKCDIPEASLRKAWAHFERYYSNTSLVNRARHFIEFPYMRRILLRRWKSLVWSRHPKWRHLVYDLLAVLIGSGSYFLHREVYRRKTPGAACK